MTTLLPPVVTFGEVLLRLSAPGREPLFGSNTLETNWGGAEANVAAGLAHLGVPAQHVTVVPHNPLGDAAVRALQSEGVDTRHVQRGGARMGLYFLDRGDDARPLRVTYDRAQSAFAQLDGTEFDWSSILAGAGWLHLSGISPALGDGPLRGVMGALDAARAGRVPVSVDLNLRPALWVGRDPMPIMQPIAARADLLIGNPGAIGTMLGVTTAGELPEPPDAVLATAQRLHAMFGCARIAITQRQVLSPDQHRWQAHLWEATTGSLLHGGLFDMSVIDRAGGGDAFAAALLHQLLHGSDAAHAIRFATAAGALKNTMPGDVLRASATDVDMFLAAWE